MSEISKAKRSYIMSRIRKTDSKPELKVRKYLFKEGFRYRLYGKHLPGNPDIVFSKYKVAIFVNGCFWHAHKDCKFNKMPKSNTDYWIPKILRNVERDTQNYSKLNLLGWKVITVWECDLADSKIEITLRTLKQDLNYIFRNE